MSNIQININDSIIERVTSLGLSLDYLGSVLFILIALYDEEYELLDTFDDRNKQRRVLILYEHLHRRDLIEPTDDNEDHLYELTERGVELVKYIRSFDAGRSDNGYAAADNRSGEETESSGKRTSGPASTGEVVTAAQDVSEWIGSWIELFPPQKIEGRYLRTNKHECSDRMRWFLKEYEFDKETIFKATKAYIQAQETSADGHRYTRNSSYFIFKGRTKHDRTSDLATWCQRVLEEGFEENKEAFNRDVI